MLLASIKQKYYGFHSAYRVLHNEMTEDAWLRRLDERDLNNLSALRVIRLFSELARLAPTEVVASLEFKLVPELNKNTPHKSEEFYLAPGTGLLRYNPPVCKQACGDYLNQRAVSVRILRNQTKNRPEWV